MPSTATIAAMPMAMPSADSAARRRRLRRPIAPTRSRSRGQQAARSGDAPLHGAPVSVLDRGRRGSRPGAAAAAAMSRSWVMTTIVVPSAFSSWSSVRRSRAGARVEVAGRLVGEHDRRPADERAGDGHALALAAGQLRRAVVERGGRGRPARSASRGRAAALARAGRPGRAGRRRRCRARSCPSSRKNCWNTKPICARAQRRQLAVGQPRDVVGRRRSTSPVVGRSSVPMMCSSVDLPEPDGPTMATSSPSRDVEVDVARARRRSPG